MPWTEWTKITNRMAPSPKSRYLTLTMGDSRRCRVSSLIIIYLSKWTNIPISPIKASCSRGQLDHQGKLILSSCHIKPIALLPIIHPKCSSSRNQAARRAFITNIIKVLETLHKYPTTKAATVISHSRHRMGRLIEVTFISRGKLPSLSYSRAIRETSRMRWATSTILKAW